MASDVMSSVMGNEFDMEKSSVLEELLNLTTEDIGKINISDLILSYFENYKSSKARCHSNVWAVDDQAIRQMHLASHKKSRRIRYYPGSSLPSSVLKCPTTEARLDRLKQFQIARKEFVKVEKIGDVMMAKETVSDVELASLAAHMVENQMTAESIENELSVIFNEMTSAKSFSEEDFRAHMHATASQMVANVISRAQSHIDQYMRNNDRSFSNREDSEMSFDRIEAIAADLVASVTEKASRLLSEKMQQDEENETL